MTAIEFNQLSKDDISKFNYNQIIDFYKFIATVSEKRYIDYKSQLENLYKSKINTELGDWFKQHLRELKNEEEIYMKKAKKRVQYLNAGMDLPETYRNYKYQKND